MIIINVVNNLPIIFKITYFESLNRVKIYLKYLK